MKIALLGYGRMGKAVEEVALDRGHQVVARLDADGVGDDGSSRRKALTEADVAIDFSIPGAVRRNVESAAAAGVNLVVGTTGWEEDQEAVETAVREARVGLLHAPNFSLGVNLFLRVVKEAARILDPFDELDVHLMEAHHRHKVDHPGGTARRLAEILVDSSSRKEGWSRELPREGAVDPATLQVAVVRAGEVFGTHSVGFDGTTDRIELRHEARGRRGFAHGSVVGAEWIRGREGVFSMEDFLQEWIKGD